MRFTIISTKPGHQPPQSSCDFYAPGGTIGRGTDNNLVLPDNDRTISRLQAIVHVDAQGECRVTNRGSVTRVVLNDIPLERGRQVELQDGDILGIDDYRIEVTELIHDTQPVSRMAASMQQQARPTVAPTSAPQPKPASAAPRGKAEPTAVPSEIWDSLMQEFSISDSISSNRAKPQPVASHDPFSQPAAPERNAEDPLAMFNDSEPKLERKNVDPDTLFSDEALFKKESIFDDVTPSTLVPPVESKPAPAEETTDELDPLALFGGSASAPAARNDDPLGLMGGAPLTHPDEIEPEPSAPAPETEAVPQDDPLADSPLFAPEPQDPPRAEEEEPVRTDYAGFTMPTPQAVARSSAQTPKGRLRIDPVKNAAVPSATAQNGEKGEVLQGELLEALLEGMGLSEMQPVPQFDRENMRQLGQILGMFSQGTVALLSSRSILKRGVKADMTMVLDDANNPFKLLPTGKTVLIQMFGTPMPGFMPPTKSVRDALIDLQAHQLGMISGIRAIIAAMLQSFNPEQLEEQAKQNGMTSRLALPGSRKAALWDYFVRSYGETAGEIEDDFHTLFGEAFLHAYDMEVNQYKDSQSGSEEK
ncbi:type VI secretion system-associated FHA domain protein TagH [Enterobacter cloacae subsp. cloacae]|uniref:type VI secretion system-associated FHA domain protein TagH n=1 Tax=Enterobacter cloacae TaxID=550 RepID=UPI001B83F8DF|nr:type VI secretion system-associated FHA domain protein TagH [Enterobacter cloacae]MDR9970885.1 type VI secretion system-associated FHA domain protein TagH [Enterobacter cloacae subsp. cloacae]MDS0086659.1 type VI secretion system-associated FHA domain protein TagH [Enterobacter cloacae subsp. cloacae]HBC2536144.1 type VI secretion system-associated FHA domain protein TagH [Enterobacter cloacae]HBC2544517.1 type VI secretion system-associated FHA domain protein TagH [Enterobacter cloacae]HCL